MTSEAIPPSAPATRRLRLILGGLLLAVIAFSAGYVVRGMASPPAATQAAAGDGSSRVEVSVDDDPSLGAVDAPVTIIEFSDYQCPYCGVWHAQVFGELIATYGTKVRFVYRDFPLDEIHPEARPAAIAATCAGEQGKYWEYHNLLFTGDLGLSAEARTAYAQRLGLDLERFATCVARAATNDEVDADQRDGLKVGVRGTPTFFINGRPLVGAQPLEAFTSIIDDELN
jgi:protein-disulfide isomerase